MKRKNLAQQVKQRLIEQSLQRKLKNAENISTDNTSAKDKYTDFTQHSSYRQIAIFRHGAEQLGLDNPFFRVHDGRAGALTDINGQRYINFSSYNYLGLSGDPRVNNAVIDAVARYGTSVSASRMVSGERAIHRELELALAETYQVDDALVFVSGHATNVSTISYLMGSKDLIVHDELIHNSITMGAQLSGAKRLAFAHNDMAALEHILQQQRSNYERVLVVVEGIYSMDGDYPDLPELVRIKQTYASWLMVDEAHSFGVLGERGLGIREHFSLPGDAVDIWMGTLSKSLASCGGYIAGSQPMIDILRNLAPGFLYSVGMPAQLAAPALAALQILRDEPWRVARLRENSRQFLDELIHSGFDTGNAMGYAVVPLITGNSVDAGRMSGRLFEHGINVQPIVYPAVPEKHARLRFFLSSEHTPEQIKLTIDALRAVN